MDLVKVQEMQMCLLARLLSVQRYKPYMLSAALWSERIILDQSGGLVEHKIWQCYYHAPIVPVTSGKLFWRLKTIWTVVVTQQVWFVDTDMSRRESSLNIRGSECFVHFLAVFVDHELSRCAGLRVCVPSRDCVGCLVECFDEESDELVRHFLRWEVQIAGHWSAWEAPLVIAPRSDFSGGEHAIERVVHTVSVVKDGVWQPRTHVHFCVPRRLSSHLKM